MGTENKGSTFPKSQVLNDLDNIKGQFLELLSLIDREEETLIAGAEFPFDDLNRMGSLSYEEINCYGHEVIEEMLWQTAEVIRRIDVQSGRVRKILNWLNWKLNKALAMMPQELLEFKERETKYCMLSQHYSVVRYLLEEYQDYQRQEVHWQHLSKNMEKKERILWHILDRLTNK